MASLKHIAYEANLIEPMSMCDFCSRPLTGAEATNFRTRDFTRRTIKRGSTLVVGMCECHTPIQRLPGDEVIDQHIISPWAACPICAEAIIAGDKLALAMIASSSPAHRTSELSPDFFLAAHEPFWLHREGEN